MSRLILYSCNLSDRLRSWRSQTPRSSRPYDQCTRPHAESRPLKACPRTQSSKQKLGELERKDNRGAHPAANPSVTGPECVSSGRRRVNTPSSVTRTDTPSHRQSRATTASGTTTTLERLLTCRRYWTRRTDLSSVRRLAVPVLKVDVMINGPEKQAARLGWSAALEVCLRLRRAYSHVDSYTVQEDAVYSAQKSLYHHLGRSNSSFYIPVDLQNLAQA